MHQNERNIMTVSYIPRVYTIHNEHDLMMVAYNALVFFLMPLTKIVVVI